MFEWEIRTLWKSGSCALFTDLLFAELLYFAGKFNSKLILQAVNLKMIIFSGSFVLIPELF